MSGLGRRTLRSGKEFSEFDLVVGPPIEPPQYFSVADCLRQRLQAEEITRIFDEPADVQPPPLPSSPSPSSSGSSRPQSPAFWLSDQTLPDLTATALTKKQRKKIASKKRRRAKRERDVEAEAPTLKGVHLARREAAKKSAIQVALDSVELPHSKPSWIGKRTAEDRTEAPEVGPPPTPQLPQPGLGPQIYTQEELDRLSNTKGFRYIPWLGEMALPIIDSRRRLILVLGGKPKDPVGWHVVTDGAAKLMDKLLLQCHFTPDDCHHRRAHPESPYPSILRGVSHGGGQTEPGELHNHPDNIQVTDEMLAHKYFKQIVGFTHCLVWTFAPILALFCQVQMGLLAQWNPALNWPFVDSIFAACTFNFGPRAITCPHLDFGNLAWGWCAITSLGWFDPDRGGHLILWDLKLIIRFPPGSTILIPSAIIRHSNIPVQPHEKCFSFVQYTAGELFRWIRNGYMTDEDFERTATAAEKEARATEATTRWEEGVSMFSSIDEL
ncbi:hypothetical protein DFH08DRAFT_966845 [Mycena albidolilacea]|uniref:Uncharacterized protein n=1 Tax=Mycena albidolilacea TaxID=1033008 RepID=A0AAD6ZMJ9_9AGAR|nr:hypothetical protein DFH08DRAFT_966845 [Mycena albidolilacea]